VSAPAASKAGPIGHSISPDLQNGRCKSRVDVFFPKNVISNANLKIIVAIQPRKGLVSA